MYKIDTIIKYDMFFCRASQAGLRKIVDLNRNYCLIFGLALFLYVIDLDGVVEIDLLCDTLTLLTHYIWLSVFAWTALEGYLLFQALIVVWDTGEKKVMRLYVFGYGAPAFISILTLIIIVITERGQKSTVYHKDNLCWLSETYIYYAFLIPVACVLVYNTYIFIRGLLITYRVICQSDHASIQFFYYIFIVGHESEDLGQLAKDQRMDA